MLINLDVKSLEAVVAAQLSGDKVLKQEILDGQDIHANNMKALNLPTRDIAKIFIFRLIYGGSAYSYANDLDFKDVSQSENYWQGTIDSFYDKYNGLARWHREIIREAQTRGRLEIPSGRYYPFEAEKTFRGAKWPITKIKNYPVQGYGADLVMLARIEAKQKIREAGIEACDFVSTVHDSIVVDTKRENLHQVASILLAAVKAVPQLCMEAWNHEFDLPLNAEIQYGMNKKDMVEYKFT